MHGELQFQLLGVGSVNDVFCLLKLVFAHHSLLTPSVILYHANIHLYQKTEQVILSEDGKKSWKNNCWTVREDYFECLHSKKEWAMVRRVNEEEKRQAGLNKSSSPSVPAVEVPVSPPLPMRGLANPDSLGRA